MTAASIDDIKRAIKQMEEYYVNDVKKSEYLNNMFAYLPDDYALVHEQMHNINLGKHLKYKSSSSLIVEDDFWESEKDKNSRLLREKTLLENFVTAIEELT